MRPAPQLISTASAVLAYLSGQAVPTHVGRMCRCQSGEWLALLQTVSNLPLAWSASCQVRDYTELMK